MFGRLSSNDSNMNVAFHFRDFLFIFTSQRFRLNGNLKGQDILQSGDPVDPFAMLFATSKDCL